MYREAISLIFGGIISIYWFVSIFWWGTLSKYMLPASFILLLFAFIIATNPPKLRLKKNLKQAIKKVSSRINNLSKYIQNNKCTVIILTITFIFISFCGTFYWIYPQQTDVEDWVSFSHLDYNMSVNYALYRLYFFDKDTQKTDIEITVENKNGTPTMENCFDVVLLSESYYFVRYRYNILGSDLDPSEGWINGKEIKNICINNFEDYRLGFQIFSSNRTPKGRFRLRVGGDEKLVMNATRIDTFAILRGLYYVFDERSNSLDVAPETRISESNESSEIVNFVYKKDKLKDSVIIKINTLINHWLLLRQVFFAIFTGLVVALIIAIFDTKKK